MIFFRQIRHGNLCGAKNFVVHALFFLVHALEAKTTFQNLSSFIFFQEHYPYPFSHNLYRPLRTSHIPPWPMLVNAAAPSTRGILDLGQSQCIVS